MCQLFSSLIFCLFVFLVLLAMVLLSRAISPLLDTISQLFCAMSNCCIYFDLRLVVFMHKFLYVLGRRGVHGGILSLQIIYQSSRYHFVFKSVLQQFPNILIRGLQNVQYNLHRIILNQQHCEKKNFLNWKNKTYFVSPCLINFQKFLFFQKLMEISC